jgi:iron complex outermembrane receptor protein
VEFSGNDAAILAAGPSAPGYKQVFLFHNAPLQMSAPFLANLWSRFDVTRGSLKGLYLAGGFNLVFDQTLLPDTPPQFRQTYGLINALVGYSRDVLPHLGLTLEVFGKNLANAHYRPSQSTRSRPREIAVVLKAQY